MALEVKLEVFEGPLDLILFLLGKNKLEIQDISISLICGQYIAWLEDRQRMDLEVASEFVIMASHLVYLKTRMLLSIEDDEAKSEMDALLQSLEERRRSENYVRVKALAQRLAPMGEFGRNIVTRNPEPVKRGKVFEYSHQPADLVLAMAEIQNRAERKLPPARFWQRVTPPTARILYSLKSCRFSLKTDYEAVKRKNQHYGRQRYIGNNTKRSGAGRPFPIAIH